MIWLSCLLPGLATAGPKPSYFLAGWMPDYFGGHLSVELGHLGHDGDKLPNMTFDQMADMVDGPPARHHAALLKHPKYRAAAKAKLRLVCADGSNTERQIKTLQANSWGLHNHVLGLLSGKRPAEDFCLAIAGGSKSRHKKARLRHPARWKLPAAKRQAMVARLARQMHNGEGYRNLDQSVSKRSGDWYRKHLTAPHFEFYAAKLPGKAAGLVTFRLPASPDHELELPFHGLFIVDKDGVILERLATSLLSCGTGWRRCERIGGIGDVDGDGYDDILVDARNEWTMGNFTLRLSTERKARVLATYYGG